MTGLEVMAIASLGMTAAGGITGFMGQKSAAKAQSINDIAQWQQSQQQAQNAWQAQQYTTEGQVLSAKAGVEQAQGNLLGAKAQADAAAFNIEIANRNEATAIAEGEVDTADVRRNNLRNLGAIHAAYGASGLAMEGSSLDVLMDTAVEGEISARRTMYQARVRGMDAADKRATATRELGWAHTMITMADRGVERAKEGVTYAEKGYTLPAPSGAPMPVRADSTYAGLATLFGTASKGLENSYVRGLVKGAA